MPDRALLICDLDETLIDGNSFRLLVIELARPRAWWSLGPTTPLRLGGLVARRAARRLDRVAFKRRTHALVRDLPAGRRARLADRMALVLGRRLRPDVSAAVTTARELGCTTYLATAAFEEHARPLATACGFDHVVATTWPTDRGEWVELRAEVKRDAVVRAAAEMGAGPPWILLSDHEDDEPLADLCEQVFWVARRTPLRPGLTNEVAFTLASFSSHLRTLGAGGDGPAPVG